MRNEFKELVESLKLRWVEAQKAKSGWLSSAISRFSLAIPFYLTCIDELMKFVSKWQVDGSIKKVAVMEALSELYDTIIYPLLPFWAKAFSGTLKDLILNVGVSSLIDFLVKRLRENVAV